MVNFSCVFSLKGVYSRRRGIARNTITAFALVGCPLESDNDSEEVITMPLHDWTDDRGWDSVHQLWINALLFWAQDRLPSGYRAYLGSVPGLSIGTETGRPDVGVRAWKAHAEEPAAPKSLVEAPQPDFKTVALLHPEPRAAV